MVTKIQVFSLIGVTIVALVVGTLLLQAPNISGSDLGSFQVSEGESLSSISKRLEERHIIRSALLFRGWISFVGHDTNIGLGVYDFTTPLSMGGVVRKFIHGPDEPLVTITVPEGSTTGEIADLIKKAIPTISTDRFGQLVNKEKLDGYLFPSTYYPLPSSTEEDMIRIMNNTFEKEYGNHFSEAEYPKILSSRNDVISLAAILESEAKTPEDMRIVSGILQKRLEKGMRLQVDAAETTYKIAGLPEQPINNPGIVAIEAVFKPLATPYLYYLTGKDGKMYYSKTFEEHKKNIQKYLK